MKFHLAHSTGNIVTGLGDGWVRVGATEYRANLVLMPDSIIADWAGGGFDGLTEADFAQLAAAKPDVAILGTGAALRFPPPRLTRALVEAGIGLEVMDTAAACRTYNILAAEGRKVAAGLLIV